MRGWRHCGAEGDICTEEGRSSRRLEEIA